MESGLGQPLLAPGLAGLGIDCGVVSVVPAIVEYESLSDSVETVEALPLKILEKTPPIFVASSKPRWMAGTWVVLIMGVKDNDVVFWRVRCC